MTSLQYLAEAHNGCKCASSCLQVLRFYKKELKQLTERLRQEGVGSGQPEVKDDSMDSKLNALSSLAGKEDPMTMGRLAALPISS